MNTMNEKCLNCKKCNTSNNNKNPNKNADDIKTRINDIIRNLNSIKKEVYRFYPDFEIDDISKIISYINSLESEINKSNSRRIERSNKNDFIDVLVSNGKFYLCLDDLF